MEQLQVPLSIDITVGDSIISRELKFRYKCMFDDSYTNIMKLNKKTIIAEKFKTFMTDNIINIRTKDFYNLYILLTEFYDELNKDILVKAIKNTFKRRETNYDVENIDYDDVMASINLVIKFLEQGLVGV